MQQLLQTDRTTLALACPYRLALIVAVKVEALLRMAEVPTGYYLIR